LKFAKSFCIAVSLLTAMFFSPALQATEQLPVEAFAALPSFSGAQLSPSGNAIAYAVSKNGRRHIIYQDLDGNNSGILPPPTDAELGTFYWANDNIILVETNTYARRKAFVRKVSLNRILAFNRKKSKFTWLGKPKTKRSMSKYNASRDKTQFYSQFERIVDLLSDDPKHILMQLDFDLDTNPDVFKVNVYNGRRKLVRGEYRGIQNWYTDSRSKVRAGFGFENNGWFGMVADGDGNWKSLKQMDWAQHYTFKGFSEDPNTIYVSGNSHFGTNGLFKLDLVSGNITETVFAREQVDARHVIQHPVTGHVAGVAYREDFSHIEYFDRSLRTVQASMNKALKGKVNSIVGRAHKQELYLIYSESAKNPGDYFLFDRKKGELSYIAPFRDHIDPKKMANTHRVTIPVRDGSHIPGYMTVPKGKQSKSLPAIVLPHGGPYVGHDNAEWDYWAQFYASRGYLVLKPNFRGTKGYGNAFYRKGVHQWGGLMQDDVTDATKWLIAEGMADPERICIVGGSYGGYAALMGSIKEQGLYKCAISVNGVTNMPLLKKNDKELVGGNTWIKRMGLRDAKDSSISPFHRAREVSAAVMLVAARDDARVPFGMSNSMHHELQKHNKQSAYVELADGGHSMLTGAARLKMLQETEKFLAEHIGD